MSAKCKLLVPQALHDAVMKHLFPGDHDEHALVIAAGVARRDGNTHLLARDLFFGQEGVDHIPGRHGYRMLRAEFIRPIIHHCRLERLAYIAVHNHGGSDRVSFSSDDIASHERGFPALLDLSGGMPVGAAVYAPRAVAGDIWMPDGTRRSLGETRIIGANITRLYDRPETCTSGSTARPFHERQLLMFGHAGQALLQGAKVAVIGAGGVGSLLVEYLARLGVGRLVVVDNDRIALSNLSRVVGATRWDARFPFSLDRAPRPLRDFARQRSARKIDIAKRVALQANPHCSVETIFGDFAQETVARHFLDCDFLFLAADSMRARLVFNAIVQQYYIPGIQIGSKIVSDPGSATLEDAFSVERWVLPAQNCLWCSGMISAQGIAMESKTDVERKDQDYGSQAQNPSVITMNAVGASHAVNDFLMSYLGLHDGTVTPKPRRFKHLSRRFIEEEYPPAVHCTECRAATGSRFGRGDGVALPTVGRL